MKSAIEEKVDAAQPQLLRFQGFRQQSASCQVQLKQMAGAGVFFSLLERTQFIKSRKEISSGS